MTVAGDILELAYGKALSESNRAGGNVPVVGSSGIVGRHDAALTTSPAVVVGRKGSIGTVHWLDTPAWPIDTTYYVRLKRDGVDLRWVYWLLKSLPLKRMNKSAAVPGLNRSDVYRLQVDLPSLAEQLRIAETLDAANALCVKHALIVDQLNVLRESTFIRYFGDPNSWSQSWPMGSIKDLAVSVRYGTSSKSGDVGEWPILRMGNVIDTGMLDLGDLKYADLSADDVIKYSVRRGDLLFNRTNSKEKVGKSAVVRTDRPLAIAGYLVRVRFEESATAEFVAAFLNSHYGRGVRKRIAKVAVNQANINAKEMAAIPVAMPPIEVQRSFEKALEAINRKEALVRRALASDQNLFSSLQHRAFRGEL